ncbi:putative lipoprotein YmbA [Undibacterium sp. GrIS 1.8]|uniref:PqiC family protein n=1 Tax=unclassified Undibacterium TaxID=2630295 RepID=UPI00339369D0
MMKKNMMSKIMMAEVLVSRTVASVLNIQDRKAQASKIILTLFTLALTACATPYTERYYQLTYPLNNTSGAQTDDANAAKITYELIVADVRIPDSINRNQLVVQKSATESVISDDQRWVALLDEQIGQAVVANLRSQLPGAWIANRVTVSNTSAAGQNLPRYHLAIQVAQLLIQSGDKVTLEAIWILQDGSKNTLKRERTVITVPVSGAGYDPIAPAVSESVRQLSEQIAKGMLAARATQ